MSTKKITEFGLLLAVSLIFSYVETLVPVIIAVPGIKLGLANMITIMILYPTVFPLHVVAHKIQLTNHMT